MKVTSRLIGPAVTLMVPDVSPVLVFLAFSGFRLRTPFTGISAMGRWWLILSTSMLEAEVSWTGAPDVTTNPQLAPLQGIGTSKQVKEHNRVLG